MSILENVERMAHEKKCTPAQLSLAWVMAQGEDVVPIPGTKRRSYLEENVGAAQVALTAAELDRLNRAAPVGVTAGMRYHESGMRTVNR